MWLAPFNAVLLVTVFAPAVQKGLFSGLTPSMNDLLLAVEPWLTRTCVIPGVASRTQLETLNDAPNGTASRARATVRLSALNNSAPPMSALTPISSVRGQVVSSALQISGLAYVERSA